MRNEYIADVCCDVPSMTVEKSSGGRWDSDRSAGRRCATGLGLPVIPLVIRKNIVPHLCDSRSRKGRGRIFSVRPHSEMCVCRRVMPEDRPQGAARDGDLRSLLRSAGIGVVGGSSGGFRCAQSWIHRLSTTLNRLERQENRGNGSDLGLGPSFNLLISDGLSNPCAGVNGRRLIPDTLRSAGTSGCPEAEFSGQRRSPCV